MRPKRALTWISLAATAVLVAASCGNSSETADTTEAAQRPGTLLAQRPLTNGGPTISAAAGSATYIRYISTAPDKSPIEVSGAVYLPKGQAPEGGWPLVAYAHGTSGVASDCAPTNSPGLYGNDTTVADLLDSRKAVVMTNYQGLDGPGAAPYLHAESSGYDVLDSVRAAQQLDLPVTEEVVLVGLSQGGRATESAAETAKAYAPDLKIIGNVLLSPALRSELAQAAETKTLTIGQYLLLPYLVAAVRYNDPDYSFDKVLHGALLSAAPRLEGLCTGQSTLKDLAIGQSATPAAVQFVDDDARQALADYEASGNLPKVATDIPTFISRGDNDDLVNTAWGNQAVADMCSLGTDLVDTVLPGGHEAWRARGDLVTAWINDRFAGAPVPATTCRR
ncbi:lipase family protein [Nocardia iowensis]|uniref:Lipase family protein n=1 Tax=Nocardia iowensis TaxID=204891 RepID=A0ABX8RYV9_NOCIO|nr:lipase family protein [Nocardia iowensis]QXN94855.1 lipase family protein [Nocardia iowensis]